jgi:hypothetical protein
VWTARLNSPLAATCATAMRSLVIRLTRASEYPHIARLMEAGIDPDDPNTREERFQFSLDCVLDGIAARLEPPDRHRGAEPAAGRRPPGRLARLSLFTEVTAVLA